MKNVLIINYQKNSSKTIHLSHLKPIKSRLRTASRCFKYFLFAVSLENLSLLISLFFSRFYAVAICLPLFIPQLTWEKCASNLIYCQFFKSKRTAEQRWDRGLVKFLVWKIGVLVVSEFSIRNSSVKKINELRCEKGWEKYK